MKKRNHLRNSVKAVIIRGGKLLVIIKRDQEGAYAVLPGGGQEWGETLPEALVRECQEEIGADVKVRELLFIREYRSARHAFSAINPRLHQVEFFFRCKISKDYAPLQGSHPDGGQEEVRWVELGKLGAVNLYPRAIIPIVADLKHSEHPFYLGDVN